ncbi:MBL fold metallo-hydrolase [Luteipulveratus flavus]|uniref:MBL fold metallo-hydrolase n=1 Tax=Luteipulveratus flavus TaxID=3031728 RepID=A0ABT6CC10_9MICO|nr:MBL fold metallo-hydrolase [Luteipulveratus sp. YIM 133296]MDF8265584.1 MBL fold metallo-hydrolase [Luteipulveratus sp. YIM 133296]
MTSLPAGVVLDSEPLERPWIAGARRGEDPGPLLQVRRVDEATYVLRQSKRVTYEAPFIPLLLGTKRALLLDTGAVADPLRMPLRATVRVLVDEWVRAHGLDGLELVVAHTHGHGDHTGGDAQFVDLPDVTVVGKGREAVQEYFGIEPWPDAVVPFDLGGRELLVTGAPGHDARSIFVVDPSRGLMFSGDTAYPGRLFVQDLAALRQTLTRMVELAERTGVETVVGCHIELDARGREHPVGVRFHADETPLPLTVDQLRRLRDLAHAAPADKSGVVRGTPMNLWIGRCVGPGLRSTAAALVRRARGLG